MQNNAIPTDAPQMPERSGIRHDFKSSPIYGKHPITYNAGTLEGVSWGLFQKGKIEPSDLVCGFLEYVKEAGNKQKIEKFDAYLLAVCYGAFSHGKERGDVTYSTNLVLDTRYDTMHCQYFVPKGDGYEARALAKGLYKTDIAPALTNMGRKGFYTKVLVCYIPELQEVRAIHLSSVSEAGFLKSIAERQGIPEHKASLFGLSELDNQIFGFRFSGEFEPVVFTPSEAKNLPPTVPAPEKAGKVYFQPKIKAFVFGPNTPGWEERFEKVSELRDLWFGYLSSEQSFLSAKVAETEQTQAAAKAAPAMPPTVSQDQNFPTIPPPQKYEAPFPPSGHMPADGSPDQINIDDLPF